jgi:hypothetical protein
MENFISKTFLENIKTESLIESVKMFSDVKKIRDSRKKENRVTIFLSHKHSDAEVLKSFIFLLRKKGIDVYVDWMDYDMPKTTDGSTAERIKKKIKEMDKFILLATEDAISSKWCNWELGYGDSIKHPENLAILPITNQTDNIWSGNEYLQIYPIITAEYQYIIGSYYVEYKGVKMSFIDWLKK